MKHIIYTLLLLVAATTCFAQNTDSLPPYADDEIIDNNKVKPGKKMKEGKKGPELTGLFVGSTVGLFFLRTISVDIAPYVGYRVGKVFAAGVGVPYSFNYDLQRRDIWHIYGGRLFAQVRPFGSMRSGMLTNMYFHAEGEYLTAIDPSSGARESWPNLNVGIGWTSNFEKGWAFTTEILLNVFRLVPSINSYSPVYQYRLGFRYNF